MAVRPARRPLQAEKPKVVLLGDAIVDCHIYDDRAEDADQWLAWTSPLSRDDWHYAAGYKIRQCLSGSAAIHAMLSANDIAVAGNAFPINESLRNPAERGSVFVLRQRANAGKSREERTRAYVTSSATETGSWSKTATEDRGETWRAAASFLSKSGLPYTAAFDGKKREYENQAVKVVCFWDIGRGFFLPHTEENWSKQQDALFRQYKQLCRGAPKPSILIRTADPNQFARFLEALANDGRERPVVVMVCGQGQIDDGHLRGSGTWSGVWRQTYDHLNKPEKSFLHDDGPEWRFNIVMPVYEDGVIWIGPKCWPIEEPDRRDEYLREDKRPIGKLFMVPGMQPGLSEFEEHSRIIGVHALLAYSILEHMAESPTVSLDSAIKKGLMRCRRLRSHGYCTPKELFPIEDSDETFYINYPSEIWKRDRRESTDLLLEVHDRETNQKAGPCEVRCKVEFPRNPDARAPELLRIFHTMEKQISDEFVGSPSNCIRVVNDIGHDKDALERFGLKKNGDSRVRIKGRPYLPDFFAKEEIAAFRLRQRISMQFGDFAMANPKEAAPMLDLAQRVRQHVLSNRYNSPEKGTVFNFALFGTPGSGKSFLAREIARLIDPQGTIFNVDEFNLSQFTEPEQLTREFGAIASKSVGGKVPLVLWDEFDSVFDGKRGGWLARFLMPMQDAHFFDGSRRWPLGTAVFVFIGGTFPTARDFRAWACTTTSPDGSPAESVLLKARDFHSRLYIALDMPSIVEQDEQANPATGARCQVFKTTWPNSYTKLARAVLLRQFFRKNSRIDKTVFLKRVEEDLCRFLLAIPLRHGARSLQRIVEACLVSKPSRVSMLHLPPVNFLSEHIETENVRREGSNVTGMTIEAMREACRHRTPPG
jgi:hypothetical protein